MDASATLLPDVERLMVELASTADGKPAAIAQAHLRAGGSRTRARLALSAGHRLGLSGDTTVPLAAAGELVHNASLIHDDLQDRDPVRRGRPTVWREHGDDNAILAGDLLLSAAYGALAGVPNADPKLFSALHRQIAAVIAGQSEDLAFDADGAPSVDAYIDIAGAKSGPLLALPLELPLIAAKRAHVLPSVELLSRAFALGYQIVDDMADADRDAVAGDLNIVAILAATGVADPMGMAQRRACEAFATAAALAADLPNRCGVAIERYAEERIAKLRRPVGAPAL